MSWALEGDGLGLRLSGRTVVDGVSLKLPAGQWAALVGPNGAGKSSLLSLLAGLRRPDAGWVRLAGRPLADWPARERGQRLAWLSQQGEAEGEIAVRDVVALGRLPHTGLLGSPGPADHRAVDAAMAATECTALAGRRLNALSGGERQRVLLARALAVGAAVLLLDEPTTHLDPPHQRALVQLMRQAAAAGASVVTVLHDLTLALSADRLWVMADGRLRADGPPSDPAVQRALVAVFGGALRIVALPCDAGALPQWVAVPAV